MIKKIPYITAILITVLSIFLTILSGEGPDGYHFSLGIASMIALLMFKSAWRSGKDSGKPFFQMILFGLGGLFSPVVAQILMLGIDDIDIATIVWLLLFLLPIIPVGIIGHFTRKHNFTKSTRIFLNGIPGFLVIGVCIGILIRDYITLSWTLRDIPVLIFLIIVSMLSAYAEAQIDPAERRRVQWNCWRLFLLLEIVMGIKAISSDFYFEYYSCIIFNTILRITLPLILWHWKNWLFCKDKNQSLQTVIYFIGAILLNILQSGGLCYLIDVHYLYLSVSWMLIGTVIALVVYWQKPMKATVVGTAGSTGLVVGLFGLLFVTNERLREIFYDLGGSAINIDLSTRADWLGYRINAVKAFGTGDYTPPFVLVLVILTVIVAILMIRFAQNRKLAKVVANGMVLQAMLYGIEEATMFSGVTWLPFTGCFVAEFVLMRWVIKPMPMDTTMPGVTASSTEHRHTQIKAVTITLLIFMVFCECAHIVYVNTDIDKKILETYNLASEDAEEWNSAAEQIVHIIAEENLYYIAENRTELSEEESEEWQDKCVDFAKDFLETDQFELESARDMAGQRYIKSSAVHSLLGDDTNFYDEAYTPFARLSKLKVKRLENPKKHLFCVNGLHVWITYDEFKDAERNERETLYNQVGVDYPDFFKKYDEPVLRYCFADAILALQAQEIIGAGL